MKQDFLRKARITINAGDCGSELPLSKFCGKLGSFMFIKSCVKVPQRLIVTLAAYLEGENVFFPEEKTILWYQDIH